MLSTSVDARPFAVARTGIGLGGLLIVLELRETLTRIAGGRMALPVLSSGPAVTHGALTVWWIAGVAAAVAVGLGYRSRAAAGVLAVLVALALLWDQQTYSSHVFLLVLLAGYLTLADAGAAWSVDALRRGERRSVPYWPLLLIHTQLSAVYLFASLSKVNPNYLSGEPLRLWLNFPLPVRVTASLAVLSVITELFLATGTWFRVTRPFALAAGVGLHVTIIVALQPTVPLIAFALLCVPCYPLLAAGRPRDEPAPRPVTAGRAPAAS